MVIEIVNVLGCVARFFQVEKSNKILMAIKKAKKVRTQKRC